MLEVADTLTVGSHEISFLGRSNLWVEDSVFDGASMAFAQWLMSQAISRTHPGQVELIVFDDQLTGIAAPFIGLNNGGERLIRSTHDIRDLAVFLAELRDHVQEINSVMQGKAPSLLDFRAQIGQTEGMYKLVVLATDVSVLEESLQNALSVLLRSGPRAGVSFLIHSPRLGVEWLSDMCEPYSVKRGELVFEQRAVGQPPKPPTAWELIEAAEKVAESIASSKPQAVEFAAVQSTVQRWSESSANGITFAVGQSGGETVEITLGDEVNQRHNALVTGAVGMGKSNLLSVIVHSLCQRYSPEELELYLLDFKEGVTLQAYFDEESGRFLPHARVLGLEADREFGLSVLKDLHARYKERMRLFKKQRVQSIAEYRAAFPEEVIPRIAVVVDEFQMLFADRDRISDQAADLLIKGVRLFRAAGIHIVLASQTIGGNTQLMGSAGEGLFGQVPVRLALKNSLSESRATLGSRNEAAARLRAREAIVNRDYGALDANQKSVIAFADERVLQPLRDLWWGEARDRVPSPYVFTGEAARSYADDAARIEALTATPQPLTALLGLAIEVGGRTIEAALTPEAGRNIAGVGPGEMGKQLLNIGYSLAAQAARHPGMKFVILDGAPEGGLWSAHLADFERFARANGADVEYVDRANIPERVSAAARAAEEQQIGAPIVYLGHSLDRCRNIGMDFQTLVKIGPMSAHHLVCWWSKLDVFREQVGYGGDGYFDVKFGLRLDSQSAKQFLSDPLLEWKPADNRMIVFDAGAMSEAVRAIPYVTTP